MYGDTNDTIVTVPASANKHAGAARNWSALGAKGRDARLLCVVEEKVFCCQCPIHGQAEVN